MSETSLTRWQKALSALAKYLENPKNPDSGPEFKRLFDQMSNAQDDWERERQPNE